MTNDARGKCPSQHRTVQNVSGISELCCATESSWRADSSRIASIYHRMESEADKIDPRRNQIDTPIIQIPTNDSMISRLTRGHCGNSSILADSIESRLADQTPLMPASHSNGRRRGAFRSMTHERTSRSEVSPEDGSKGFESRLKKFGGFHIAYVGVDSILTAKRTRIIPLLGKLVS